jgi:hypothetical protein
MLFGRHLSSQSVSEGSLEILELASLSVDRKSLKHVKWIR